MVSVENVYVCLVAPILLTLFLLKNEARRFNLFFIIGMTVALTAGFINPLLFGLTEYSPADVTIYVSPISEEILKALPLLLYIIILKPSQNDIIISALAIGIGFATLENGSYITIYGSTELIFALIRGFASGIMHAVCTAAVGYGMCYAYDKRLAAIFTFGLLSAVITYHSIFNMLVTATGSVKQVGWIFPILTAIVIILIIHKDRLKRLKEKITRNKSEKSF